MPTGVTVRDNESFEQYQADANAMGESTKWIKEQDNCMVTLWNGSPIAVEAPNFVVLEITETDPGLKGDTSGGGGKPATLETGAVVRMTWYGMLIVWLIPRASDPE